MRALEVNEITGEPFIAQLPAPVDHYPNVCEQVLRIDREQLDVRIEQRVDAMWAAGFVDEVRIIAGCRVIGSSDRPRGTWVMHRSCATSPARSMRQQARQRTLDDTRKFARRQQRWFAKDERIQWFDYDTPELAERVAGWWTAT